MKLCSVAKTSIEAEGGSYEDPRAKGGLHRQVPPKAGEEARCPGKEVRSEAILRTSFGRESKSEPTKALATKRREAKRTHCQETVRDVESSCIPLHVDGFVTLPDYPWNIPRCWPLRGS